MTKNAKWMLLVIVALVIASILTIVKKPPVLGLDLKGGTRLTLQATPSESVPTINASVMNSLQAVLERRVNKLGVAEAVVQRAGRDRILVEIPGITDPQEARNMLGKVGNLEFRRMVNGQWVASGVSGKDLAKAEVSQQTGTSSGRWIILFSLNAQGAKKFGDLTAELAPKNEPLGIFFDGQLVSAPSVRTPILQGEGMIEGDFTLAEVKDTVALLNAGALPANIEIIQENTVGPLLGESSIHSSLFAGLIGIGLVIIFMMLLYRAQGLIADMALIVYTLLTYAAFLLIPVTFTLAGIAGFILSIGMAVDANILIFERTKEELRNGRSLLKAIEVGFERAFPSIFDSNTTTLITCALLWWLGTGAVKGFALTLAIGVAISMFSAITVTRTFLTIINSGAHHQPGQAISAFGVTVAKSEAKASAA
ncbi:MAG: protein translocase subunit SecD [Vampirovibrionales bacterium]|nr:protein translocase subunit SecD [Vampirovibrionales bacterium]